MKTKPSIMLERMSFFASGWRAMLSLDLEMVMPIAIAPAAAVIIGRLFGSLIRGAFLTVFCCSNRAVFRACFRFRNIVGEHYAKHQTERGKRDDEH